MKLLHRLLALAFVALLAPLPALAQERPNTILVLDASGSMWGQIDGVNKIVIAREVVADILADFPADQNLGLVAYGHRARGDCSDIELMIPPAPGTADEISRIVGSINPRGMTPMTDAVIAAAEALRYTENAATVILVSDGIETCNPDPCAAARALAEAGVDFTAHVIGFDVAGEAEALMQMQCIADETGGRFFTADNAGELAEAMREVIEEVTTTPISGELRIHAVLGTEAGPPVPEPVLWSLDDATGAAIIDGPDDNPLALELAPGQYIVHATNVATEAAGSTAFTVSGGMQEITVVIPIPAPVATLQAPDSAPAGSMVSVHWQGPDESLDNIRIGPAGTRDYSNFVYTQNGNPASLVMPWEPGDYELRYMLNDHDVIATRPITVTEARIAFDAPASVPGGTTLMIGWTGPDQSLDNIQVGPPGASGYFNYVYTERGNPAELVMPWDPGQYELRYRLQDREVIHTQPITITPGEVSMSVPKSATTGAEVEVHWTGPGTYYDNIVLRDPNGQLVRYRYLHDGSPVRFTMSSVPGVHEFTYRFMDRETILTVPILVTEAGSP